MMLYFTMLCLYFAGMLKTDYSGQTGLALQMQAHYEMEEDH